MDLIGFQVTDASGDQKPKDSSYDPNSKFHGLVLMMPLDKAMIPWDDPKRIDKARKELRELRQYHKYITAILVTKPDLRFHSNKTGPQLIQEIRTTWQSKDRLKIVGDELRNYREKVMLPLRLLTTPICLVHTNYSLDVIPGDERKLAIEKNIGAISEIISQMRSEFKLRAYHDGEVYDGELYQSAQEG